MKFSFIILTILIVSTVFSQSKTEEILVAWSGYQTISKNEKEIKIPVIKDFEFSVYNPTYLWTKATAKNANYAIKVLSIEKSIASAEDLIFLKTFNVSLPSELAFSSKNVNSRNQRFLNVQFPLFFQENGTTYKVAKVVLETTFTGNLIQAKSNTFANSSVLGDASSTWYKISVTKDGIVKIDKDWLIASGIDVSSINPSSFHIYGNGDGRLSEKNADKKVDDLAKNAILFVGNNDNTWDDGEYILFYAWGPHRWNKSGNTFTRNLNIYDDHSYYFIRISSNEAPLYINQVVSTNSPVFTDVNSFNHYDIYENETTNLVGGGQRWYGELFDVELSRSVNFSIPNIVTSQGVMVSSFLASVNGSNQSTFNYTANGTSVKSLSLPSTGDYYRSEASFSYLSNSSSLTIGMTLNRHNPSVLLYLDKIEINARRNLVFTESQLNFRDLNSVALGSFGRFTISNVQSSYFIWDVTDRQQPKVINPTFSNGSFEFIVATDSLREFVCSNGLNFNQATFVKQVVTQNLHALSNKKLLIVTHPNFKSQADRLAAIHEGLGTTTHVVTTEQVYNEFSGGSVDPTAIRWFAKMFYYRANGNLALMPENLLLFGDGTYDPKNRLADNNYYIPTYQFITSENLLNAIVTDDYFGMLDDTESIENDDMMDIGVGRMVVSSNDQASQMIDKIEQYLKEGINTSNINGCNIENSSCSSFGDWRLKYVQIADDEESFIINDTEPQYYIAQKENPLMNSDKIYLDAYQQVASAGGDRYPEVFDAISERMQNGALIVNYVGHGGEVGAADERVITIPQIESWTNWCNMPVFVSATCEFSRFDDPSRVSAGEVMYLSPKGGAIALMTTTRSVFYNVNAITGKKFYENVFDREANGQSLSFGEIMRRTKNASGTSENKRSFTLLGDPALRIAMPYYKVVTDSMNGHHVSVYIDTMKALSKVTIKGRVVDLSGNLLSNFNGVLRPTIFDKKQILKTLGQDSKAAVNEFEVQKNALFKGKSTVKNGLFEFSFIVPKDINYTFDLGKISYYANSETDDAGGIDTLFYIGGINPNGIQDNVGPEIKLYLNSDKFINGGLINENPVLIAEIDDENGINMVGNGIGHDITAVLDGETSKPVVLNNYYSSELDSYQKGKINYQFRDLEPGRHTLMLKVWDVNNNSSESTIDFEVQREADFQIAHVLNYPNPFTTNTAFYFEHNQLCSTLDVMIQIMTISGKLVKTIHEEVYNDCFRSDGITWNGRDDFGDQLAKGVYIYRLRVKTPNGEIAEKLEKLVLLK